MNKLLRIFSIFIIILRTVIKKRYDINNTKNVLIVFQQVFGDSVVIQSSLRAYEKIFNKENGYTLYFIARPSVMKFMRDVLDLPKGIIYEEVDFRRFVNDYKYYKFIINKYRNIAGITVVPGTSLSAEIFSCAMNSARKIGLVRPQKLRSRVLSYILNKAYTEPVIPSMNEMMFQRHQRLLNYLGANNYVVGLPKLISKSRLFDKDYAVICPGSSMPEKCWSIENFASVADFIVEKFNLDIHLCGGKNEDKYSSQLVSIVKHPDKIVNHIGLTSFSDWSAIVQHAEIVVGNDSATIHLAAAARVPSVCISGVYDKFQFFPYKFSDSVKENCLPTTIMNAQKCEWCRTIGYYAGYGNKECRKAIRSGKSALCISSISLDQVITTIKYVLLNSKKQ